MELHNFSQQEITLFNSAFRFIRSHEFDASQLPENLKVIKTEQFLSDCDTYSEPHNNLGTESLRSRLILPNVETPDFIILINQEEVSGLAALQSLIQEFVHLSNYRQLMKAYTNPYRFSPEDLINRYYYEFILWTRFHAKKLSLRCFSLMSWHEANGDEIPPNGNYQFGHIAFHAEELLAPLKEISSASAMPALRSSFWDTAVALADYFGRLAVYQQVARPQDLDDDFPEQLIEELIGLEQTLELYSLLQGISNFPTWMNKRDAIRTTIKAMEGKAKIATGLA